MRAGDVLRGRGGHRDPGAGRPGDRHQGRCPVRGQGRAGVPITADHVHDARRVELLQRLAHPHRAGRCGVRRLEHDGTPGGESGRELPDGHHHRVVPWRHLADDARPAPGGWMTCGRACTRRTSDLPEPVRRRRRTGSGRPSGRSPRTGSGRSACRCPGPRRRPVRRRSPRGGRRTSAAPAAARPGSTTARSCRPPSPRRRRDRRPAAPDSGEVAYTAPVLGIDDVHRGAVGGGDRLAVDDVLQHGLVALPVGTFRRGSVARVARWLGVVGWVWKIACPIRLGR